MKTKLHFTFFILIIFLAIILSGCPEEINLPAISTIAVSQITDYTAVSGGNITDNGGASVLGRGLVWSTNTNPTLNANVGFTDEGKGTGIFSSTMYGLSANTPYYVSAYATNEQGTAYGEPLPFTTFGPPTVVTVAANPIDAKTATLNATVNPKGSSTEVTFMYWRSDLNGNYITAAQSPVTGTTEKNVSADVTGLTPGYTYYFLVFANSDYGSYEGNTLQFNTLLKDFDGNVYNTVAIGTQVWMKPNLKTTHFSDGTSIPLAPDGGAGYYWYNNDEVTYKNTYGALYNYSAVYTDKLCPTGWHVPTDAEWTTLTDYLTNNGYGYQGSGSDIAKSLASTNYWTASSTAGTIGNDQASNNSSGFNGRPGGLSSAISTPAYFYGIGESGSWWSSTYGTNCSLIACAWSRSLIFDSNILSRGTSYQAECLSVRCVRDY
jgi:uncharacterized protein (TIGR02145 family)